MKMIGLLLLLLCIVNILTVEATVTTTFITANYGTNIELRCYSSTKTNCNWKKNTISVLISDRYLYKSGNGKNTTDCSINIELFHEIDSGFWTCWSLSDDGRQLNSSHVSFSRSYQTDIINPFTENITTDLNQDVDIKCRFNIRITECVWLRNHQPVMIKNRYRYTNNEEGHYSTDCSISISKVQTIDSGTWRCAASSNSRTGYLESKLSYLTINGYNNDDKRQIAKVSLVQQPKDNFTRIGSSAKLTCIFNEPVERCIWLRNQEKLTIQYRYQFTGSINGKFTNDCSVEITSVRISDIGTWQCLNAATDVEDSVASNEISLIDPDVTNQSNIEIQTSFENVTVASGKSVIFICTFSKSIDCNWERNGIKISIEARYAYLDTEMGMNTKNCSIIITNVTSLDVGQWTCGNLATSKIRAVQLANFHLDLIVQKEPSFPKIIYNNDPITELMLFSVDLNENLSCTSQNGYPAPRLYWKVAEYKIHKLLQEEDGDDNNLYNSTLNWNILSEMHYLINASELQCIAEHPLFLQPKIATLKIIRTKTPSRPLIFNNNSTVHENESLSVFGNDRVICSSTGGFPAPSLKWLLNGQQIAGFRKITKNENHSYDVILKWDSNHAKFVTNATELKCELTHPDFQEPVMSLVKIDDFETLSQPTITFNTTSVKELNVKLLRENTDLRCSLKFKRKYPTLYWEYNGLKIPGQFQIRKDDIDDGKDSIELSWNPLVGNGTNDNVTELTCVADYPFINKLMKSSLKLVQLESKNYGVTPDPIRTTSTSDVIIFSVGIICIIIVFAVAIVLIRNRKRYKWEVGKEHHTQPANLPKTTEKNDNEQFIVKI